MYHAVATTGYFMRSSFFVSIEAVKRKLDLLVPSCNINQKTNKQISFDKPGVVSYCVAAVEEHDNFIT